MKQGLYVGVDTGGTFTDVVVMDESGAVLTNKAPTTPQALEDGVFAALSLIAEERGETLGEMLAKVVSFGHGTTQATNALIERRGATTGLITTKGFGDTLLLQRLMGFTAGTPVEQLGEFSRRRYPDPLVPRNRIKEVLERVDQAGQVIIELDETAVRGAVEELAADGVTAYAIALLWSFRNPAHERRIGEIVREIAGEDVYVSLSSEVNPVLGEYERTSTTVLNSYLGPSVQRYLERMERKLIEAGMSGRFSVLNSIGGVMSARDAADRAVLLLASGPTGGVLGSQHLAEQLGHRNVITSDMGGTSFDVGLIVDGRPVVSAVTEVAQYHVAAPMVSITAIGAGGGSIAEVVAGELRVGPESAGAFPGPVCYRRGGTRATVTDADVVLGVIDPDTFLGGRMRLDKEAAERAIAEQIAEPLGLTVVEAAAGIRHIVDSRMADTLRELSVGRGLDPRDFVLYAYGGAGPMHCAGFGADLGVTEIVVPATSMAHSAYGALAADIYHSAERSHLVKTTPGNPRPWEDIDAASLDVIFAELEASTREQLARDGVDPADTVIERSVDVRYRSQTHELITPVPDGAVDAALVRGIVERFEASYEDTYGRGAGFREAGIELTTFRVSGIGRTPKPSFRDTAPTTAANAHSRPVYDLAAHDWMDATVVQWHSLEPGETIPGPAVVEHPTTTVYTGHGQRVGIDTFGNLIITA
ncbi:MULTISPECIES: hydantoinase/oxoprolinase family protein [Tsukamurella]|uniref:Hydantoinase/oxoprolinase family protein n=2 Tax=Tsukamurella TaxID=2060 RepID=A0A5C5S3L7_9ACTN|nr:MULTISPECIES: hydantoinase/oxoprolinase family protein [Tsukamurella]NMD56793.1 hydantoinase/oxoprolinase family protein [Tsukamurella columbiensis]TWS29704.1 hydantoinase/oxoprolinase family protein [Tsukamurella conjunctivitidis]